MTEITKTNDKLPEALQDFILQWGDMGNQWGVNRSVAQIHALLYISDAPMHAEQIADTLGVARSNVSNSLKELLQWRLISRTPMAGDRRDHFKAEADVWTMVMRIAEGRKLREIDPAARALKDCIDAARSDKQVDKVALKRLENLFEFITTVNKFYDQMLNVPRGTLMNLMKMGSGIIKFMPGKKG